MFIPNLLAIHVAHAGNQKIVVYPVYHNDADKVVMEIIDGLQSQLDRNLAEIALDITLNQKSSHERLGQITDDNIVIAITSDISTLVRSSGFHGQLVEAVSDGTASVPSSVSIGVKPSPEVYIKSLKRISPNTNHLIYFYPADESSVILDKVKAAAKKTGITIDAVVVNNINDAMKGINSILSHSDSGTDAVWIPNSILAMANNTVLKFVLRETWRKSVIVYTDSLDAVLRGLLFTLVPDYFSYGEYIARYVNRLIDRHEIPASNVIPYFDDVYLMINQRFSVHIGLNISRSNFEKYKIVVPAK